MKKIFHFFKNYLRHIRAQPQSLQRLHAFSLSGIVTIIIAFFGLHYIYGWWSGPEYIAEDPSAYEVTTLSPDSSKSPAEVLKNFWGESKKEWGNVMGDLGGIFESNASTTAPAGGRAK